MQASWWSDSLLSPTYCQWCPRVPLCPWKVLMWILLTLPILQANLGIRDCFLRGKGQRQSNRIFKPDGWKGPPAHHHSSTFCSNLQLLKAPWLGAPRNKATSTKTQLPLAAVLLQAVHCPAVSSFLEEMHACNLLHTCSCSQEWFSLNGVSLSSIKEAESFYCRFLTCVHAQRPHNHTVYRIVYSNFHNL